MLRARRGAHGSNSREVIRKLGGDEGAGAALRREVALALLPDAPLVAAIIAAAEALSRASGELPRAGTRPYLDRFHGRVPGVRYPILSFYWLGQVGIAASAVGRSGRA